MNTALARVLLLITIIATGSLYAFTSHAATYEPIGYHYKYTTCGGGTCPPPTGTQETGPYQGLSSPAEQQACSSLGYGRTDDQFETPQPSRIVPGSCYEYYDMNGSIYTFDGAGQDKTIYYQKAVPAPAASCLVSPTSITTGGSATWTATASGGTGGPYTYSWSGTDGLGGSGSSVTGTYNTAGTKTASVTVTSGGVSTTASCSNSLAVNPPPSIPTASISASPVSITSGQSSTLTYSCTNATSASIDNGVGSVSATGGTVVVSPTATTNYTLTCTGSGGTGIASVSVAVTPPAVSGSCSVSPTSITTGGSATWTASASGGTGSYTYSWSGTDGLGGSASAVTGTYNSAGTKTASVTITSGSQSSTINCSNSLTVTAAPVAIAGTCSVSPSSISTGGSATWTAIPSGGTGSYIYTWSGTDGLGGSTQSVTGTYNTTGTKTATVVIADATDQTKSATVNCSNSLTVGAAPQADLTAGSVSPSSATVGIATSFLANASNVGNATSGSFPMLFQIQQGGSDVSLQDSAYGSGLAAGGSQSMSTSYTFNTAGTYQIRACANFNTSWTAITSESNYSNNCGAWTTVTVTNGQQPVGGSCSVAPTSISSGGSATWTAAPSGGNGTYTYSWSGTDGLGGSTQSVTGTYNTTGTKTASVTISSAGGSATINCSNSLTVGAAPQADLTAGQVSPGIVQVGSPTTFSAMSFNNGNGSSGSFPTLFQIQQNGTDVVLQDSAYGSVLAPGGVEMRSTSITLNSAGTYQIRACANFNTSWVAITPESDYTNNCGPWNTLTVQAPPPPPPPTAPTCSLSGNPANNVPSTLTWSSTDATSCTGGGFSTGGATSGSVSVTDPGSYSLSCSGAGGSCSAATTLSCTNPSGTLTASPDRLRKGQSSTLRYSATGINASCTITGPAGTLRTISANSCSVPSGSVSSGAILGQSVFILTCDGAERARVIVNLLPQFQEF